MIEKGDPEGPQKIVGSLMSVKETVVSVAVFGHRGLPEVSSG